MKLAWATDIHLNFLQDAQAIAFIERLCASDTQAILLGGDIAEGDCIEDWLTMLAGYSDKPIYYVLGNHDYYRSDIVTVQTKLARLQCHTLAWLPQTGVVPLNEHTALVGHDGWGDGRNGDFMNTTLFLRDYIVIKDLADAWGYCREKPFYPDAAAKTLLRNKLQALADAAAEQVEQQLTEAAQDFAQIIFLTHVPPFAQACTHGPQLSDTEFLPGFSCKAIGDAIARVAQAYPHTQFEVLCGHTHCPGDVQLTHNIRARTGYARYGSPDFMVVDFSAAALKTRQFFG